VADVETITDIFGDILRPLRLLVVAGLGLIVASALFDHRYAMVALLTAGAIGVALVFDRIGQFLLPRYPQTALIFFEAWVLAPAAVTVVVSGAAVVIGYMLTPGASTTGAPAEIMKAMGTAVATFLGAFVSWVSEKDDTRIADRIRRHFWAVYDRPKGHRDPRKKYFAPESRGELAVYSGSTEGCDGWGLSDRWGRARIIAEELESGASDAPP
jgi:hypothetical protein